MKPFFLASVFLLTLLLGLCIPQVVVAKEKEVPYYPNDFTLKHLKLSEVHHDTKHRSVPIPGTEFLLGAALVGIVCWRAGQKRGPHGRT